MAEALEVTLAELDAFADRLARSSRISTWTKSARA